MEKKKENETRKTGHEVRDRDGVISVARGGILQQDGTRSSGVAVVDDHQALVVAPGPAPGQQAPGSVRVLGAQKVKGAGLEDRVVQRREQGVVKVHSLGDRGLVLLASGEGDTTQVCQKKKRKGDDTERTYKQERRTTTYNAHTKGKT